MLILPERLFLETEIPGQILGFEKVPESVQVEILVAGFPALLEIPQP